MRKILAATAVATLALAGATPQLQAQEAAKCHVICAPVFVAQPGLVISSVINKPTIDAQGDKASSSTHFLARFTTVIPTTIPRTAFVALVQWTPYARSGPELANGKQHNGNAPAFVYGPVFDLIDAGPVNFSIDALGVYAPSGSVYSDYKHIFVMEGIAGVSVGHLMQMMGGTPSAYLKGIAINGLYSQQISDRVPDFTGSKKLTPNVLVLLTLPISPLP